MNGRDHVAAPARRQRADPRRLASALVADVAIVVLFVAVGRRSHDEASGGAGVGETAAPFLIALLGAWIAVVAHHTAIASRPVGDLDGTARRVGVAAGLVTVSAGLVLRRCAFDRGTALSFVIVTVLVLGGGMVAWRVAWRIRSRAG